MKMFKMKNEKKGFSLVELMIVMAIIALLSVVLIPRMSFAPERAAVAGVITDFRSFETAVRGTLIAKGSLPTEADIERDLAEFGDIEFTEGSATITDEGGQTYTISIKSDKITFTATHIEPNPTLEIDSEGKVTTENTGTARD